MLSNEQIDQLYRFCEKKFVRYYDVQVELVDHLANAIEERMKADPAISFEKALDKVYSEFGIFGFAKVVRQKEYAAIEKQKRLFFTLLKDRLSWPKVLLFLTLSALHYFTIKEIHFKLPIVAFIVWSFIIFWLDKRRHLKIKKRYNKISFTLFEYRYNIVMVPLYFLIQIMYNKFFSEETAGLLNTYPIASALFFSFLYIVSIVQFELNKKIDEEVTTNYPAIRHA